MLKRRKPIDVKKMSLYAIVINSLQIIMMGTLAVIFLSPPFDPTEAKLMPIVIIAAAALVMWGAIVDIREAIGARKTLIQVQDLESAIGNIESLNHTLRAQRHDFLNHLQVVYSLIEMEEYEEANEYIEKVYGAISSVSRSLKTKSTAVNALLQVKTAQIENLSIACDLSILSDWADLPVQGWEMCRVLSNLIDNAIDAVEGTTHPYIGITLSENVKQYLFKVENSGHPIPEKLRHSIFMPGITTKSEGHGMGLFIVKKTLSNYGGGIDVSSDSERTVFHGFVPKAAKTAAE